MAKWVCLKCKHKWSHESKIEPRRCPVCGAQTIMKTK